MPSIYGLVSDINIVSDAIYMYHLNDAILNEPNGLPLLNSDAHLIGPIIPRFLNQTTDSDVVPANGELVVISDSYQYKTSVGDGETELGNIISGIEYVSTDSSVVTVQKGATADENGTNLLAAYALCKTLSPGGSAKSSSNRATLKIPAGNYNISGWNIDTNYIDVEGEGYCTFNYSVPDVGVETPYLVVWPKTRIICSGSTNISAAAVNIKGIQFYTTSTSFPLVVLTKQSFGSLVSFYNVSFISNGTACDVTGAGSVIYISCDSCYIKGDFLSSTSITKGLFKNCVFYDKVAYQTNFYGLVDNCHCQYPADECFSGKMSGEIRNSTFYSTSLNSNTLPSNGTLYNCRLLKRTDALKNWNGKIYDCVIIVEGTDKNCIELAGSDCKIYDSTLIANGTGYSVYASDVVTTRVAGCIMNKNMFSDVSNLIDTPYNIIDSDVTLW